MTKTIEQLAKEHQSGTIQFVNGKHYCFNLEQLEALCKAYHAQESQDAKDAERYRCLKPKYVMANFDIYDADVGEQQVSGIVFEMPEGINYGADLDDVVDQAIASAPTKGE